MKISNSKLHTAIEYINEINSKSFLDLDLSEILFLENNRDLSYEEKIELFWAHEKKTNIEIIAHIIHKNNKPK